MTSSDLAKLISTSAGVLLSLCVSYIPGFSDWYYKLTQAMKGGFMVLSGVSVALVMYLLSCVLVVYPLVLCDQKGIVTLVEAFVFFMIGNQGTYLVTPDSPAKVRILKEQRNQVFGAE